MRIATCILTTEYITDMTKRSDMLNKSPIQYSIKSKQTRCIKNSNLRKEVGIAIKSKETRSQFESVRNSYAAIMHQPVTICSTM